mgnify:CR=1 FL=1
MLFLKKAWAWLKTHWYFPILLVLLAITYFSGRARVNKVLKMFEVSKESYDKQIDAINKSHEQELKKREELYTAYVTTMKKLEKEHKESLSSLDEEKKKKLDEMVKKYKGSPEELANELSEMFGVKNG